MNNLEKINTYKINRHVRLNEKQTYDENEWLFSAREMSQLEIYYDAELNVLAEKLHKANEVIVSSNKIIRNLSTVLALVFVCVSILSWRLFLWLLQLNSIR